MQYIVGFFAYHKKGKTHESSVFRKQVNKQQCVKRKLLSSLREKSLTLGEQHI